MRLDRRQFHALALASLAASLLPGARTRAAAPSTAVLYLNRLTFGANVDAIADFEEQGLEAWLDEQLSLPPMDDALDERLRSATLWMEYEAGDDGVGNAWPAVAEDRPYIFPDLTPVEALRLVDFENPMDYSERIRPALEIMAASLTRAVHAKAQLREVMTQFWHNHFNVNSTRDEHTAALFPVHDAALRDNALGNFRQLLGAVARSPAMLFYLNNEASRASPANENFGRELLELHTLGAENYLNDLYDRWRDVPGSDEGHPIGYIDQDVYEVARAFTGWSFGDGRWIADGEEAPRTGEFHYIDLWHDPYQKRVLGIEFDPNRGPMADGEQVLDILAAHPGTARFICRKIARRLLTDEPDDILVQNLADVFRANDDAPDQIAQVVRTLVLSETFASTPPSKLKRPFEFLASFYRASGHEIVSPGLDYTYQLNNAGWAQHEHRPPNGPSDKSEDWANTSTLGGLVNIALMAHDEWYNTGPFEAVSATPEEAQSWRDAFRYWSARIAGGDGAAADSFLEMVGQAADDPLPDVPEDREWVCRTAIGMAALQPEFLFR